MLEPKEVYDWLADVGASFYAGVPDSLLKDLCAYITDNTPAERHVITANEGSAIALAMGHHLATGDVGVVYLQNSGLGNTVNPLTSLCDRAIYGIPLLLIVGWRGEPDKKDEPQHVTMGRVTEATLSAVGVPYTVLPDDSEAARAAIASAMESTKSRQSPHAIVVRKGTFSKYALQNEAPEPYPMTREAAIAAVAEAMPPDAIVISTTGKPSRELFETRRARAEPHRDLLIVGGMGHASQIALGVALERGDRQVWCIDGDGAVIMHMGGLATIASLGPANYKHIVLNNAAHDSVGGQPTVAFQIDICGVARACGYAHAVCVTSADALPAALQQLADAPGPAMVEVRVKRGARSDLGRPTMTPRDLKEAFMAHCRG